MKKYLLILSISTFLSLPIFAQGISVDVGAGGLIPLCKFRDSIKTGLGGSLTIGYAVSDNLTITGRSGYFHFPGETVHLETATRETSFGIIPVLFGIRYYLPFSDALSLDGKLRTYGSVEVGVFVMRSETTAPIAKVSCREVIAQETESKFGFSPTIGFQYKLSEVVYLDIDGNYSYIATEGNPTMWFGFGVGLQFDIKY